MSDVGKMVLFFIIVGMVLGGLLFVVNGLTSETAMVTTVPYNNSLTVNTTAAAVDNVSMLSLGILVPVLILAAVFVVILALMLITRRR